MSTAGNVVLDALNELLVIKQRWFALDAFQKELDRVSRGKSLLFTNDVLWHTMLDTRDMLLIVLDDWVVARVDAKHGLFAKVGSHLHELAKPPENEAPRAAAFRRCFPDAAGGTPTEQDLDGLRRRFRSITVDSGLSDDRNRNRAHYFRCRLHKDPAIKMLDVAELGGVVAALEKVLNDLLLVAHDSTVSMHNVTHASPRATAEDLVDLIVCGSSRTIHQAQGINAALAGDKKFAWEFREPFYDALHEKANAEGWDHFNENLFSITAEARAKGVT